MICGCATGRPEESWVTMPKAKKRGSVKRYIVASDSHAPLHDKKANNCLLQAIGIVKPDGFIHAGDIGEWGGFSHWQWKRKKKPPLEYQIKFLDDDINAVNSYLDDIDKELNKYKVKSRIMIQGNHELWIDYFIEEYPYMHKYSFPESTNLKKRGYEYIPNHEKYRLGKLYIYHGNLYGGQHHAKNHLLKMGVNVMYGDKHDLQQHSITHIDGEKSAWCIGCLKSLKYEDNEFTKGRPHNWGHAFAIVDVFENGLFSVHVVRIIEGKCSLWGEVIYG